MNQIIVLIWPIIFTFTKMCIPSAIEIQYYSPGSGEIVCWDACWHEVGHKLDWEVMDHISYSDNFQNEVINFLYIQMLYITTTSKRSASLQDLKVRSLRYNSPAIRGLR